MCQYSYRGYIGIYKRYVYNNVVEKLHNKYSIDKETGEIVEEEINKCFNLYKEKELMDLIEEVYQSVLNKLKPKLI